MKDTQYAPLFKDWREVNSYPPSEKTITGYRKRHAPLLHIETEAAHGFYRPMRKSIDAYTDRMIAIAKNLPPSIKRMTTLYSIMFALSIITIHTHA